MFDVIFSSLTSPRPLLMFFFGDFSGHLAALLHPNSRTAGPFIWSALLGGCGRLFFNGSHGHTLRNIEFTGVFSTVFALAHVSLLGRMVSFITCGR